MDLTVDQAGFARALRLIGRAVPSRPTLPVLQHVLLEAGEGRLTRAAIDRSAFAAADDAQRPVLCGVLFDFGPEGLTLAAADGFRLARARLPETAAEPRQLLVPARAVDELGRLLATDQAARLVVLAEGRGVRLEVGEATIFVRLIDGAV